jgi:hypothetical protein
MHLCLNTRTPPTLTQHLPCHHFLLPVSRTKAGTLVAGFSACARLAIFFKARIDIANYNLHDMA